MTGINALTKQEERVGIKRLALLIDPENFDSNHYTCAMLNSVDIILVGGSTLENGSVDVTCKLLKEKTSKPIVLFPGSAHQISKNADAILFLSLISGRNPEYLIGQQIKGAPLVKASHLKVMSCGYMLVECGKPTTVNTVTETQAINPDDMPLIKHTAMAGEMLGMKHIYLEAGSGADNPIPTDVIRAARSSVKATLWVGGGIQTPKQAEQAWKAGADVVVIGSIIEKKPKQLNKFVLKKCNFVDE